MPEVKLISVEPSDANAWCSIVECWNLNDSKVVLRIGNVTVNLLLCDECKVALLKEVGA